MKGFFITFEGPDGSGKTTVATEVCRLLKERGYDETLLEDIFWNNLMRIL